MFRTPGQLLKHFLEERGWTQIVLGAVVGLDVSVINKIISGKKAVSAEMALTLGEIFEVPPERFLDLQTSYDLARARIEVQPDPNKATRARLFGDLPVSEMIKRGWIRASSLREIKVVEGELVRFFNAIGIDDIPILSHSFKRTDPGSPTNAAQLAWLYRVKRIAREILVPRYSPTALQNAISTFKEFRSAPELARHVPRLLMESGVRFLIVETIGNAKVDGVCFWMNQRTVPVVALSFRFDRIDNFWFVLRHELEHVIREHGRDDAMLDAELEGERASSNAKVPEEERIANAAAEDFCVPIAKLEKFLTLKASLLTERDMLGFARTLRIHPGLVAGQLRHKTGRYELFTKHLVKVKFAVAPNAMVDGWGDVAPIVS